MRVKSLDNFLTPLKIISLKDNKMTKEVFAVLSKYNMNKEQQQGIEDIWNFLTRFSLLLQEDYKKQHKSHPLNINDFKMITHKIVPSKMGFLKEITSTYDIPFRTAIFFNNHFTDLKNASTFFNEHNRANGIKWLMENHISKIPNRWVLSDWIAKGLIAHKSAIYANYTIDTTQNKRTY